MKSQKGVQWFYVADNQTIARDDIVVFSSGKLAAGADAATAGTVVGFALEACTTTTATAADYIPVDTDGQAVRRFAYDGTGAPEVGLAYDLDSAHAVDTDDTTNGYVVCVGNVDTTNKLADFGLAGRYNKG